ncbi:MAG: hypothetical protein R3A10_22770 [Caldilineaceae bacterium]
MDYRRLGRAGMKVAPSTWAHGSPYGGNVEDDTAQCIHSAISDVNFIDCFRMYAGSHAEEAVGGSSRITSARIWC